MDARGPWGRAACVVVSRRGFFLPFSSLSPSSSSSLRIDLKSGTSGPRLTHTSTQSVRRAASDGSARGRWRRGGVELVRSLGCSCERASTHLQRRMHRTHQPRRKPDHPLPPLRIKHANLDAQPAPAKRLDLQPEPRELDAERRCLGIAFAFPAHAVPGLEVCVPDSGTLEVHNAPRDTSPLGMLRDDVFAARRALGARVRGVLEQLDRRARVSADVCVPYWREPAGGVEQR